MRSQQRLMMDQLYGPLIKQLGLTPEEAEKFKELLLENQMSGVGKASALFGGGAGTNRAEALNAIAAAQRDFEEQMKEFLGKDRYAQYKDYQQTVGERAQLNQFKQQMAGAEQPLTDQQTEQLLAIKAEERKNLGSSIAKPSAGADRTEADLQAFLSSDAMEKLLQDQENINQRVYERARGILSPVQLEAFGQFQTNQVQTLRFGISMSRQLLAPDKTTDGPAQPNP